jgi:hypothetical protein
MSIVLKTSIITITTIDYYSVAYLSAHCREQHLRKYLLLMRFDIEEGEIRTTEKSHSVGTSHPIIQSCPLLAWASQPLRWLLPGTFVHILC